MVKDNVNVVSGTLTLSATPTSNPVPPTSSANPHPAIHYARSATICLSENTTLRIS